MTESTTAIVTTSLTELHALIGDGLRAIERQVEHLRAADRPEALAVVQEIEATLRGQRTLLDVRARALGGTTARPLQDAVTTVAGLAAGLLGAVRPAQTAKAVRDDYTFLGHVAIHYLMLHATASALGDHETATIAERGYHDAARLVIRIDRIMPALIAGDLRDDGVEPLDVGEQTAAMVAAAWDREGAALRRSA